MTSRALVVDASALIEMLLSPSDLAEQISNQINAASSIHAPDHIYVEVVNVLRRQQNAEIIASATAEQALSDLYQLPITLWPFKVLSARSWELGVNFSSYDAAYVALAEHLDAPLLTRDKRIGRAPGPGCELWIAE